ncbi:hypothetical protein ACH5RR_024543 [Cinchona calisaya]|uniref:EGF-like domain-containing protein n=1 Tax=Cinchona calisaya TaxID=153742 RepID=A0ABD2YZ25_9GENT
MRSYNFSCTLIAFNILLFFLFIHHITASITTPELLEETLEDENVDHCEKVDCGQGTCVASLLGFDCLCKPGWNKMQFGLIKFPACTVPNCTLNYQCGNDAPPPLPSPPPANSPPFNIFNPCNLVWCGDGTCIPDGLGYYCKCNNGSANLFNMTGVACLKECFFGVDCKGVTFGHPPSPPPPSSPGPKDVKDMFAASKDSQRTSVKALTLYIAFSLVIACISDALNAVPDKVSVLSHDLYLLLDSLASSDFICDRVFGPFPERSICDKWQLVLKLSDAIHDCVRLLVSASEEDSILLLYWSLLGRDPLEILCLAAGLWYYREKGSSNSTCALQQDSGITERRDLVTALVPCSRTLELNREGPSSERYVLDSSGALVERQAVVCRERELNQEEPAGLGGPSSERYVLDSMGALVEWPRTRASLLKLLAVEFVELHGADMACQCIIIELFGLEITVSGTDKSVLQPISIVVTTGINCVEDTFVVGSMIRALMESFYEASTTNGDEMIRQGPCIQAVKSCMIRPPSSEQLVSQPNA